jgi:hypothetical protein
MDALPIDEVDYAKYDPDDLAEFFECHYRERNRPLVIRGAALRWPALDKWTFDYLAQKCGSTNVPCMVFGGPRSMVVPIPADEALRRISDGGNLYISLATITPVDGEASLPMLMDDCEFPTLISTKSSKALTAFIGRDSFAPLHHHGGSPPERIIEAIKTQLVGTKTAVLFPPNSEFPFSRIQFKEWLSDRQQVLERYPRLRELPSHQSDLAPGDMLFIPAYWWHCFFGHETSMSATCFWKDSKPSAMPNT